MASQALIPESRDGGDGGKKSSSTYTSSALSQLSPKGLTAGSMMEGETMLGFTELSARYYQGYRDEKTFLT